MIRHAILLVGLISVAACQPAATTQAADAAPPAFSVGALAERDINIQGCTTMLSRAGATEMIFVEDGLSAGAKGFIRIDGQLMQVGLTAATESGRHSTRNFADAEQGVEIVESLTIGAAHEESDSVEQSGVLAITYKGATQTIQVEGGTAC